MRSSVRDWQNKSDEELIALLRKAESGKDTFDQSMIMDYLLEKYKNLVRKKANALFLLGGDTDDLIQEGMIGLFKAIQNYQADKEKYYWSWAVIFVGRDLNKALIRYLENRLVEIARECKRYTVLTKNTFKNTVMKESKFMI